MIDVMQLRELLSKGTPGEWRPSENDKQEVWADRDPAGWDALFILTTHRGKGDGNPNDVALIIALHNNAEELLAAAEAHHSVGSRAGGGLLLGTVTVTKTLYDDDILVNVTWETPDGDALAIVDALGMIELAKDSILRTTDVDDG